MKKIIIITVIVMITVIFLPVGKAQAATLTIASASASTSRPSASAPLTTNQLAATTSAQVADNGSIYLASDSATFRDDTGETIDNAKNVASMSAQLSISGLGNTRTIYFTNTITNTHHKGDPVVVAITATHHLRFQVINTVPVGGSIKIQFPPLTSGDANNAASPSASTFQLNNLVIGNVKVQGLAGAATFDMSTTAPAAGTSPTITITLTGTTFIPANQAVTVAIGCSALTGHTCSTPVPTIINPTKTAAAGTSDATAGWPITVTTRDVAGAVDLDSVKLRVATIESVQVYATVEPTLTVTIAGLASSNDNNTVGGGTCGSETSVNTGISSTATEVNMGVLGSGFINRSAQKITVSTNGFNGYVITATSSGKFIDVQTGSFILDANGGGGLTATDTPAPGTITAGTAGYGISPCGTRVSTTAPNWGASGNKVSDNTARFSNPWNSGTNSYNATLASYTGGAVANEVTVVRYGATIAATTPAGTYANVLTYVTTPTF